MITYITAALYFVLFAVTTVITVGYIIASAIDAYRQTKDK